MLCFLLTRLAPAAEPSKPIDRAVTEDLGRWNRSALVRVRGIAEATSRRLVLYPEADLDRPIKPVVLWVDGPPSPDEQLEREQRALVAQGRLKVVLYRVEFEGHLERAKNFRRSSGPSYTGNGFGIDGSYGLRLVVTRWIGCERLGFK